MNRDILRTRWYEKSDKSVQDQLYLIEPELPKPAGKQPPKYCASDGSICSEKNRVFGFKVRAKSGEYCILVRQLVRVILLYL